MRKTLYIAVLAFIVGLTAPFLYARVAQTADPSPAPLQPQVPGRLVNLLIVEGWDTRQPGYTRLCESDAIVNLEGQTVTSILTQGDRPEVKVGDRIAENIDIPPRPGASAPETGELGQVHVQETVYWGGDGQLHVGCAPESVRIETR